jgi:hypothetical protein
MTVLLGTTVSKQLREVLVDDDGRLILSTLGLTSVSAVITPADSPYTATFGELVRVDARTGPVTIELPTITPATAAREIMISKSPAYSTGSVDTLPQGSQTVAGLGRGDAPGFTSPNTTVVLVADGDSDYLIKSLV